MMVDRQHADLLDFIEQGTEESAESAGILISDFLLELTDDKEFIVALLEAAANEVT